jgi:putative NIF3 family GTP cyclohydrolase 1 type 2
MQPISRRDFVTMTAAGTMVTPLVHASGMTFAPARVTAQEIVDRIKANIGVEWRTDDVDTFKAGDPSTVVTGIVTTSMATLDVLQKAVQAGANLVITASPTFSSRADLANPAGRGAGAGGAGRGQGPARSGAPPPSPATVSGPGTGASAPMPPAPAMPQPVVPSPAPAAASSVAAVAPPDPVYAGKNAFIEKNKLVVFRLTQHWNQRTPDPRALGLATAMGWRTSGGRDRQLVRRSLGEGGSGPGADPGLRYDVPAITLDALASQLKSTLGTRGGVRAIGDRRTTVRRIGLLPGYTLIKDAIDMLPTVDAIVTGEVQEWESAAYVQDVAFAGVAKGFISIGRIVNEATGMQVCADWLKTIVPEVPVRFTSAGDPYWRPV